ncbi:hypothetical protein PPYR_10810 [Photinus pyralis]|uniref:UDP-N-acetylglucosamine transferase subunit ALG13 n=2 Tax=Photinus pyralis TaxID=7054 RepID=A0A5N4AHI0_PHOPY|nr:UDP-N-acetylglucosamine transferase subunit ALG13 homolog [Photinus pyralis]KAB0796749.1 hypothetical protein PPYR_10810 [Photinus pyralis]
MNGKRLFVTVGTTKFDKLLKTVTNEEILGILHKLGYNQIQLQVGNGSYVEVKHESIELSYNTYFEDFDNEIEKSDLVISHAGAGSCLQVLKKKKPLIVVINDDLMDNHQLELAQELERQGYLYYGTCSTLNKLLLQDITKLAEYPTSNKTLFAKYINKCMGFS